MPQHRTSTCPAYYIRGDSVSEASAYFTLSNMKGTHDVKEIKRGLDTLPGVSSVSVSHHSNQVAVDFDTTGIQSDHIQNQLTKMGYEILDFKVETHTL